jgi:hypothetical protein
MSEEIRAGFTRNPGMDLRILVLNHLKETMGDRLLTDSDIGPIHFWVDDAIDSHNKEAMKNYTMEQVN